MDYITNRVPVGNDIESMFKMYDAVKRASELAEQVSTGWLDSSASAIGDVA